MKSGYNPVEVFAGNIIEAELVKSILEGHGIHAFLKDEYMGTLQPWYVAPGGAGSVKVIVAQSDLERASELVNEFNNK